MSSSIVLVTGQRFQGVDSSLEELVQAGTRAGQAALEESRARALPAEAISELVVRALRQVVWS